MTARGQKAVERAKRVFLRHGGVLRTSQALRAGVHPRTLYAMRDVGIVESLSRGLYRLAQLPPLAEPDLVSVALKVPRGVVCLVSALAYHDLTTQIPHEICLALERGAEAPRLQHPPIRVFWFKGRAFSDGIETHEVDGVGLGVYSAEKTLADCFKYRNKIGVDTATEALRLYRERKTVDVELIMRYASVCRVQRVIRPYLEAIL